MSTHNEHANEHPNYVATWFVLVVLLGFSLAVASVNKTLALILIFGVAILKAVIVGANFMHLRFEPRWLTGAVLFACCCLGFFWFGVAPDIVPIKQVITK